MALASQSVIHAPDSQYATWMTDDGLPARHHIEGEASEGQIHQMETLSIGSGDDESATDPPPAYAASPQGLDLERDGLHANATPAWNGRVNIKIDTTAGRVSKLWASSLETDRDTEHDASSRAPNSDTVAAPRMNIVMQIVGSRGTFNLSYL
ncbi:hypothetical protein H2199_006356 [Coniosporium tulheliwenetii]|uniref:Uncharacterized protein n=1 Tax=Coniosporium tulheliwenetii TaxID=3383036 RepID=A0ACC2YVD6_9PEZI|nr:hypothetical protein H2199_006356 [Cladosporium sp. JES 115]